jgi:hypothetical protein
MEKNIGRNPQKYTAPSSEMITVLGAIGVIEDRRKAAEKPKVSLTKEDDLFNLGKLSFPEGTVIAVSSDAALNVDWTDAEIGLWG